MIDTDMEQFSKEIEDAHRILAEFKMRYPNNVEELPLTPKNIARIQWHLKQEFRKGDFVEIEYKENVTARQIADSRRFETWAQMPSYMRCNYLRIADCFAGNQLAATGSRIMGEYLERWDNEDIRQMRNKLGKNEKEESDYDFIVLSYLEGSLPTNMLSEKKYSEMDNLNFKADHIRHKNPNDHKIIIPMWDFSKLPDDKKEEAKQLFAEQKWSMLMKMHNNFNLSENNYCCDETPIIKWFKWAIDHKKI